MIHRQIPGFSSPVRIAMGIFAHVLSVIIILASWSCGPATIGHGVVLWPEKDSELSSGERVIITAEQRSTGILTVFDQKKKKSVDISGWRIERFPSPGKADAFAQKFAPYAGMYAYGTRDGVPPVREQPLNTGSVKIITKPRTGQLLKIIGKSEEKTRIEEMEDYWYEVLVEYQGIAPNGEFGPIGGRGFCYGYYLKLFNDTGDSKQEIADVIAGLNTDTVLQNILANTWRPIYFQEMIDRGKINTGMFRSTIGLFPSPLDRKIEIVTPKGSFPFPYTEIITAQQGSYAFSGTNLRIESQAEKRISVTFVEDLQRVTMQYVIIDDDIDKLIERENGQRDELYAAFTEKGGVLSSSAYGKITLGDNRKFIWKNFEKLVPSILPQGLSGSGNVDFPYVLAPALKKDYDGIVTFFFAETRAKTNYSFAYTFVDNGVRFYYVPIANIDEYMVKRTGSSPVVIFFSFSEP